MSSFQRIGDKHLIGDKEGTPQKQRGREGQVHGLSCRTSASKAPACPPEQHSGDPLPEYDACEQDGIYGGRISVPCCCFLDEFPIAGCESPGFAKQAESLASVGQVAEKNDRQPDSPKEQEKAFQENDVVHGIIPYPATSPFICGPNSRQWDKISELSQPAPFKATGSFVGDHLVVIP